MGHIFLSFILYNIILVSIYVKYRRGEYYIKKTTLLLYTVLLIVFGSYGTGEGDYLHYKESVESIHSLFDVFYYNGMEVQYNYLALFLEGNYTLWRLVIFSVQFIGMSLFLYKAKLNTYPILLFFIAICLVLYTYQRSYWGVIFFFLGLYLLIEKKNPLFIIIIALCYVAHTQNLVLIALLPLGFIRLRKWQLLLVVSLVGVLAVALKEYFTVFLDSGGIQEADYINGKVQTYSEAEIANFGGSIGEIVVFVFRYAPLAVLTMIWLKMFFSNRERYLSLQTQYRAFLNIVFGLVIASLIVLFASLGAGTFFYRILSMTLFPVSILLPYMLKNKMLKKKSFELYLWIYILGSEIGYFKDMFYATANGAF